MVRINRIWIGTYIFVIGALVLFIGCTARQPTTDPIATVADEPIIVQDLDITTGQTIFVPAYSEVPYAGQGRTMELAVTLTIHNTDFTHPIIITSVRYYATDGQLVKEYLLQPQQLGPMASADFFVESGAQRGGVGTNFIVEWVAEEPVYEPVVEALMVNTAGTQGLSFTSPGRVIKQVP